MQVAEPRTMIGIGTIMQVAEPRTMIGIGSMMGSFANEGGLHYLVVPVCGRIVPVDCTCWSTLTLTRIHYPL
eukprot:scaffold23905_cov26-Cyclotella_meneghiniana.AAC.3